MYNKKNKYMTLEDRETIQSLLNEGKTFKSIAYAIGKHPTTVSKEVKKHLSINYSGVVKTDFDGNFICPEICPSLLKAPFVCNSCKKRHSRCKFNKQLYHAMKAHKGYYSTLSESREGIPLNKAEFYHINEIVYNGIKKGQHLYHILKSNNLGVSKSTIYRHLHHGYLSVSSVSFPRVVRFKSRKPKNSVYVPKKAKIGRTYDDFLDFIEEFDISSWVEMDTVIGRIGGKVILTMNFTFCNFIVGFLIDDKSALSVSNNLKQLKMLFELNGVSFGDIFPVVLADNGGEFSNFSAIENNRCGEKESSLFYCDPFKSSQKAKIEKNHTMIRDILPKGSSFDSLTQDKLNLVLSHVNSVMRKSLGSKTSYEVFAFTFGEKIAKYLGIEPILPQDVIQSPKLLK